MRYLHTMVRVSDLEESLDFFCNKLGLKEIRRVDHEAGRFSLIFVAPPGQEECPLELTYNWDQGDPYVGGRNFGHIAYSVENIYDYCAKLEEHDIPILRPPRDGKMAFIRTPDEISIELLQEGEALPPQEPWSLMPNQGEW